MGAALIVNPNPFLDAPSVVALVDVYLKSSFPLNLPSTVGSGGYGAGPLGGQPYGAGTPGSAYGDEPTISAQFDAPPLRISTRDIPTPRGQYVARLKEMPTFSVGRDFGVVEEVGLSLSNSDGALTMVFEQGREIRGKLVEIRLYDENTQELTGIVFSGALSAPACGADPDVITITCEPSEAARAQTLVPARGVTTADFPQAPALPPATGGAGSAIPTGLGRGRRLPARLVRIQSGDDDAATFRAVPCLGSAAVHAVYVGDAKWDVGLGYVIDLRAHPVRGRPCTTITFGSFPGANYQTLPITCNIERRFPDVTPETIAQYAWADGFYDWVARKDAIPTDGLTSANFITGRSGYGLGAVRFDGGQGGLEFPTPTDWCRQEFTPDFEISIPTYAPPNQLLFTSAGRSDTTSTPTGWELWATTDARLEWRIHTSAGLVTLFCDTFARGTYHTVTISTWFTSASLPDDGTHYDLVVDGVLVHRIENASPPVYDNATTPARAGRTITNGVASVAIYDLGWVRPSQLRQPLDTRIRTHFLLVRSPAEAMREFAEEAGEVCDEVSYQTVARGLPAVLQADGWVTDQVPVSAVYATLSVFRELRPIWNNMGLFCFDAFLPATSIDCTLDVGAPRMNAALEARVRRSGREAIAVLPINYRQMRGPDGRIAGGDFGEYQHQLLAYPQPAGGVAPPLSCPFVDESTTADALRDWFEKSIPAEDVRTDLRAFHEARFVTRNTVVQLTMAAHRLAKAPHRAKTVQRSVSSARLSLVPYDASIFTYTPRNPKVVWCATFDGTIMMFTATDTEADRVNVLVWLTLQGQVDGEQGWKIALRDPSGFPEDPIARDVAVLDMGNFQGIQVTSPPVGQFGVGIDILLQRRTTCYPASVASADHLTPESATGIADALDEASNPDGSVVTTGASTCILVPRIPDGLTLKLPVAGVRVLASMRLVPGGTTTLVAPILYVLRGNTYAQFLFSLVTISSMNATLVVGTLANPSLNPITSLPWSVDEVRACQFGFAIGAALVRVEWAAMEIDQSMGLPLGLGEVRVWRTLRTGTVPSPIPAETSQPLDVQRQALRFNDTVDAVGTYDYAARLYDNPFDRLLLTLPAPGDTAAAVVT